jgi:hypothetical protein
MDRMLPADANMFLNVSKVGSSTEAKEYCRTNPSLLEPNASNQACAKINLQAAEFLYDENLSKFNSVRGSS